MKLRIAGIVAIVFLLGAIVAYLWDFRESPPRGSQSPVVEGTPQAEPKQSAEVRGGGKQILPVPLPTVPLGLPKPADSRRAVVSNLPSPTDPPHPSVPTGGRPPALQPAIPPSNPSTPGTPPSPPEPDVVAKAVIEVDQVGLMLRDYRTRMGENPVGPNADIMKAVMGGNPKKARLGPPEGQQINGNGELVDRWGTPYFFHQESRTNMEIRSAGPDRKMWTEDDILGH